MSAPLQDNEVCAKSHQDADMWSSINDDVLLWVDDYNVAWNSCRPMIAQHIAKPQVLLVVKWHINGKIKGIHVTLRWHEDSDLDNSQNLSTWNVAHIPRRMR